MTDGFYVSRINGICIRGKYIFIITYIFGFYNCFYKVVRKKFEKIFAEAVTILH